MTASGPDTRAMGSVGLAPAAGGADAREYDAACPGPAHPANVTSSAARVIETLIFDLLFPAAPQGLPMQRWHAGSVTRPVPGVSGLSPGFCSGSGRSRRSFM